MSVRCPGIVLDNGRTKLSATGSARKAGSGSPELLPNGPSLKVRLQTVEQDGGESDDVSVDELEHSNGG